MKLFIVLLFVCLFLFSSYTKAATKGDDGNLALKNKKASPITTPPKSSGIVGFCKDNMPYVLVISGVLAALLVVGAICKESRKPVPHHKITVKDLTHHPVGCDAQTVQWILCKAASEKIELDEENTSYSALIDQLAGLYGRTCYGVTRICRLYFVLHIHYFRKMSLMSKFCFSRPWTIYCSVENILLFRVI
jgi:hypothetical protein